jgi:hypothetical protein
MNINSDLLAGFCRDGRDASRGDVILFSEHAFGLGDQRGQGGPRRIVARIISDKASRAGRQTLRLEVIASDGYGAYLPGCVLQRAGRRLFRSGVRRQVREGEVVQPAPPPAGQLELLV